MSTPGNVQNILIVRPSALGDVCRTVPVLVSLRKAWPEARIDWVVQDDFAAAVSAHPALSGVIPFPRTRLAGWWRNPTALIRSLGWLRSLRSPRYDLVLDCQGLGRSGLMAMATRAPIRVGLRTARELAWLAYNRRVPADPAPLPIHAVDQMLCLLDAVDVPAVRDMRLYVNESDREWWRGQRDLGKWHGGSYAVLAPTSRWLSKRWPTDRWVQLIGPLRQRGFERLVVIGSPSEQGQVRQLFVQHAAGARGVVDLVGKTTIGQTMAVIADAALVIANDSAPLHMAVGFDRRIVALFGPTDPAEVGPYGREESVIRGYHAAPDEQIDFKNAKLGDSLMRYISTAAVLQKVDQELARRQVGDGLAAGWTPRLVAGADQTPLDEPRAERRADGGLRKAGL